MGEQIWGGRIRPAKSLKGRAGRRKEKWARGINPALMSLVGGKLTVMVFIVSKFREHEWLRVLAQVKYIHMCLLMSVICPLKTTSSNFYSPMYTLY